MSTIQVVLNEDVKKLGYKGEVVSVRRGYARNFLVPRGVADFATKSRLKIADSRKEKLMMKKQQILDSAREVLDKLEGLVVKLKRKATDKGKLFGSITEDDVIAAVKKSSKVELEKEWLKMDHFKDTGDHKVVVNLGDGIVGEITVRVEAE